MLSGVHRFMIQYEQQPDLIAVYSVNPLLGNLAIINLMHGHDTSVANIGSNFDHTCSGILELCLVGPWW